MTAAAERPAWHNSHPAWCDLRACHARPAGDRVHQSAEVLVPVQEHEGDVIARVVLDDESGSRAWLRVTVRQHSWDHPGGGEMYANVGLSPREARAVASLLMMQADLAEAAVRAVDQDELERRAAVGRWE